MTTPPSPPRGPDPQVTLVVCAGGGSRRWGGRDKTALLLGGRSVLARVVSGALQGLAASGARPGRVVVVAPSEHPARDAVRDLVDDAAGGDDAPDLRWTLEQPPGGGPVAALAAGLTAGLAADTGTAPGGRRLGRDSRATTVVLAGDLPFAGSALPRLFARREEGDREAAVAVDPDRVRQPLLAVYRTASLRAALDGLTPHHASMRALLARLEVVEVAVTAVEALDLDTPSDLVAAQRILAQQPPVAPGHGASPPPWRSR